MDDTTTGGARAPGDATPSAAPSAAPSGNRWEPVATDVPLLPPEPPGGSPTAEAWKPSGGRRTPIWLAGGAASLMVAAGLGGFAVGHAMAPEGDGAPAYVQQGDRHGVPGDDDLRDGSPGGFPPQGGGLDQQGQQGGTDEGSNT